METICIERTLVGSILDIGGGGEGVIGRVYGEAVTAIDNRPEELEEAPRGPRKLVMDAAALCFPDGSFDNATAFFAFLYIDKAKHAAAAREIARVLRPGGRIDLWDAAVEKADPFLVELSIDAAGIPIHTTYGVYKEDAAQDRAYFLRLFAEAGLSPLDTGGDRAVFHLTFIKE